MDFILDKGKNKKYYNNENLKKLKQKYQKYSCQKKQNYSENHRFFPGGSMGKMIGIIMPNILLFISYREGRPLLRRRVLSLI